MCFDDLANYTVSNFLLLKNRVFVVGISLNQHGYIPIPQPLHHLSNHFRLSRSLLGFVTCHAPGLVSPTGSPTDQPLRFDENCDLTRYYPLVN